jgi:translation initiation factor IF-1
MKNKSKNKEKKEKVNPSEVVAIGYVEEAFPNAMFNVKLENDAIIRCTICGKIRKNNIHIVLGDKVDVGVSIYDMTKGRILFRYKTL